MTSNMISLFNSIRKMNLSRCLYAGMSLECAVSLSPADRPQPLLETTSRFDCTYMRASSPLPSFYLPAFEFVFVHQDTL